MRRVLALMTELTPFYILTAFLQIPAVLAFFFVLFFSKLSLKTSVGV